MPEFTSGTGRGRSPLRQEKSLDGECRPDSERPRQSLVYAGCSAVLVRALLGAATMMGEAEQVEADGPTAGLRAAIDSMPAVMKQVKRADERLVAYVREQPLLAIGAALGLGYVMGRVFSRVGR